jgi:hypothetical protein
MTYQMPNGQRVTTIRGEGGIEFVTRNAEGEVISSIWKCDEEARLLFAQL